MSKVRGVRQKMKNSDVTFNETKKGKEQCKLSRCFSEDKENTPPVTRAKSRAPNVVQNKAISSLKTKKQLNKNEGDIIRIPLKTESISSLKTKKQLNKNEGDIIRTPLKTESISSLKTKKQFNKNEGDIIRSSLKTESISSLKTKKQLNKNEGDIIRTPLKPNKDKPVRKGVKMSCKISPIYQPKIVSKSGAVALSPSLIPDDNSFEVSHILFRRRSSNTVEKEICMLTSVAQPPSEYWKLLAEERLNAIEQTIRENEMLNDQLSVLEAENSQLKEMLLNAQEIISIVQRAL